MAIKLSPWRIVLCVVALLLAQGASARKLTRFRGNELETDPVDDANFWIYAKRGDHEHQEVEVGEKGSKEEVIEQVTTPTNNIPVDVNFWIYSKEKGHHDHQEHKHVDLRDIPSNNVFFNHGDLKVGKRMKVYFPDKDTSTSPRFLPREEADAIPFSSSQLPHLLELFSIPKDSPQAKAIEVTLNMCEIEPIKGETKTCATSLESMIDFVRSIFEHGTQLRALTNEPLEGRIRPLQNYTVLEEAKEMKSPKMVGCHTMPYPYTIYYCHSQEGHQVKVFQVLLGGDDGEKMLAGAVCHMDTSHWDRDHVSFRVLGIEPGTAPVCHFFPPDNIIWLPVTA